MSKGRRKLQINPAFLEAHGEQDDELAAMTGTSISISQVKLKKAIDEARKIGKLNLNNIELTLPLPEAIFDLRKELIANFDGNVLDGDNENFWECYGEEMLTLLDISNNDFANEPSDKIPIALDDRIGCYRALESLIMRNCNLESIPWGTIGESMSQLKHIDGSNNQFTSIRLDLLPESIQSILFPNNSIKTLVQDESSYVNLPKLMKLDLTHNQVSTLPNSFHSPHLQHLGLKQNSIERIPSGFLESLASLVSLDLAENKISSNLDVSKHEKLQSLELRYNQLQHVPSIHKNLCKLDLCFNNIDSIENLYKGQMDENCKDLQTGNWFRSNMTELHLQKNKLTHKSLHIPTICVMTKLMLIDLSCNELETIPYEIGYLDNLNKIVLESNPLRMIRHAIKFTSTGGVDTEKLKKSLRLKGDAPLGPGYFGSSYEGQMHQVEQDTLSNTKAMEAREIISAALSNGNGKTLDISGSKVIGPLEWKEMVQELRLNSLSHDSSYGSSFRTFKACEGKITYIHQDWIKALPKIETLEVTKNQISKLPDNFHKFPLHTLEMARNKISSANLGDSICIKKSLLAKNLTTLNLSANNIDFIPESLFDLKQLSTLNLSHNNITTLDWSYNEAKDEGQGWKHGLISLIHLDLSNNKIANLGYLPLALAGCQHLRVLILNNNALTEIPLEIGLLEQLTSIDLLGNPQQQVRFNVLTRGCTHILQYLRDRMSVEDLDEARQNHQEIRDALKEESDDSDNDDDLTENYKDDDDDCDEKVDSGQMAKTNMETISIAPEDLSAIEKLTQNIENLTIELGNNSLSQAKQYALKKQLAMEKSKLIREQRKVEKSNM